MGNFANNAITDVGRMLLADVQAGAVFTPTRIVMGSGSMPGGSTTQGMTDVIAPVKSLAINKKKRTPDGKCVFGGVYNNEEVTEPFYFRELALYAKAVYLNEDGSVKSEGTETLYSYGNAGATADYMPAYSTSTVVEKQMDLVTWVGNDAQVDLTIESGIYITHGDFDNHAARHAIGGEDPITPADIGAVNKAGDTMTGNFGIATQTAPTLLFSEQSANTGAQIQLWKNQVFIANYAVDQDSKNYRSVYLANHKAQDNIANALRLTDVRDSVANYYTVLHTGNINLVKPSEIGALNKGGDTVRGYLQFINTNDYFAIIKGRTLANGQTHFLTMGVGAEGSTTLEHYTCDTEIFDSLKRDGRLELNPAIVNNVPSPDALILRGATADNRSYRIYGEHYSPAVVATAELI